ncbi:uncharacterized protein [Diadema antillarum]|uniref:uncharacterized protein n=1 Tax=Diadema antillarum TaxID=105358 RepID=UPI003A8AB76D
MASSSCRLLQLRQARTLVEAVTDENISLIICLLEEDGAAPNLILPSEGVSPFHLAVGSESRHALHMTLLFLEHGGDPNVRSTEGLTPVHVAASWGRFQALEVLLRNGGDPSLQDEDGNTASSMARTNGHWDCINLLESWLVDLEEDEEEEEEEEEALVDTRRMRETLEMAPSWQTLSRENNTSGLGPYNENDRQSFSREDSTRGCTIETTPRQPSPTSRSNQEAFNFTKDATWSPCSVTSSIISSTDGDTMTKSCLNDLDTVRDEDNVDWEITFPKHETALTDTLTSSYVENTLDRALESFSICNYSLTSRNSLSPSGKSSSIKQGVQSECLSNVSKVDVARESPYRSDCNDNCLCDDGSPQEKAIDREANIDCNDSNDLSDSNAENDNNASWGDGMHGGIGLDVTSPDHTVFFPKAKARDRRKTMAASLHRPLPHLSQLEDDYEEESCDSDSSSGPEDVIDDEEFQQSDDPQVAERSEQEAAGYLCAESGEVPTALDPTPTTESTVSGREISVSPLPEDNSGPSEETHPESSDSSAMSFHTALGPERNPQESAQPLASSHAVYRDRKSGVSLIEQHFPPALGSDSSLLDFSIISDQTVVYDWTSFQSESLDSDQPERLVVPPELVKLSNAEILAKLKELGEDTGPVTATTRSVYLNLLARLLKDDGSSAAERSSRKQGQGKNDFHYELAGVLNGTTPILDRCGMEMQMVSQFQKPDPKRKWREGKLKSSFNYLLLDPRVSRDLPSRYPKLTLLETFTTFVSAIFYVGKGKRSRPYAHFEEALHHKNKTMAKKPGKKVLHILDIWSGGMGVISLHIFQNVIPVEAYTREACMIDALGLTRLTNAKRGDYYGVSHSWTGSKKRQVGVHLLHKACQIFLMEGERQIRQSDIVSGQ